MSIIWQHDASDGIFAPYRRAKFGITQIGTPFRSPQGNAIAERWVRSLRTERLGHLLIPNERHLRTVLEEYV